MNTAVVQHTSKRECLVNSRKLEMTNTIKRFAYDIWSDTVDIASRMESSGETGKVNISGSIYELVKDKFTCAHRGKIQAKNIGKVNMYYAECRIAS